MRSWQVPWRSWPAPSPKNQFQSALRSRSDRRLYRGRPGGRIDHLGLAAASQEASEVIRERLIENGASDGTVNGFSGALSIFFRDPDGLEGEVLLMKS